VGFEFGRYLELARRVDDALGFMSALGLTAEHPVMRSTDFWTSHECLLLPFEQALTRLDSTTRRFYDCSAHMLWVGDKHTSQLDNIAHIEFLRGIANPIAIKVAQIFIQHEVIAEIFVSNREMIDHQWAPS
jgi:3-deoxy-7-phosphoheptulonate synthase